jgi:predicted GNAT family N-acyltransferase
MANPVPRRAGMADRSSVLAVLDGAFREDPVLRWLCPEPEHYPAFAAAFFGGLFDLRVDGGEVWVIEGAAAALWNPPGGNRLPESTQEEIWSAATDHVLSTSARVRLDRHDELVGRLLPAERGFYLGVVGVEPSRQGQGLGRSVLAPVLARADHDQQPATLETATQSNLPFYSSLGFEICGEGQHQDGPHVWCLLRHPR